MISNSLKQFSFLFFSSISGYKNILIFSILILIPWFIISEILKYNQLVFYDSYNLRIFLSNFFFSIIIIIYFRSLILSLLGFYSFIFLPFITYFFLRKGILFADLRDIDEFFYALGDLNSFIIYFSLFIFFACTILINIYYFRIKIFIIQAVIAIFFFCSYIYPQSFEKFFFPSKPNVEDFNISAAFRFIGPVDALFYNYLNTLSFEKKLLSNKIEINHRDFRSFDLNEVDKNIHIILMESFIDVTDFDKIKIDQDLIPKQWLQFKDENLFYGISPVVGGGSAQAEFEVLCGAPSLLEFGTEFNRIGDGQTNCLPNYLRKFGYKTIASQPMYGSFFNIEKAYKSIGFDKSFLTPDFDMSDMNNGWLSDESFFKQHFEFLKDFLVNKTPILNYVFAVGCHSTLGQSHSLNNLIQYPDSKKLEIFLNCNAESIIHLTNYINKILELDPESLIIILPDHFPPGISAASYLDAGYFCQKSKEEHCFRRARGIFIGDTFDLNIKNFGYYELPEMIINHISDYALCKKIECGIDRNFINLNGKILGREELDMYSDQSYSDYYKDLYLSIIKESNL